MTHYQSQYLAHALTLKGAAGRIETLSRSIANARVDLNPHQVDAALFALRSPLSRGAILADEVGLGKTIEAGIVIAQRWAERRRRILLIVPAMLRTQWQSELIEKFYLPAMILDGQSFNQARKDGQSNPFRRHDELVICSYQFVAAKAPEVSAIPWDLIVIDEAHRLRNVYKTDSKLARAITGALGDVPKLLLTATPLQNSLMELYGLVSVLDDRIFGDAASFRDQFMRAVDERARNAALRERLHAVCIRTLRKQVVEYIPFTRRVPITQDFFPGDEEQHLYDLVSAYLQRENLLALPASQRTLITLVLRKLLASSTFAIAGTLHGLASRLQRSPATREIFVDDLDVLGILEEDYAEDDGSVTDPPAASPGSAPIPASELEELRHYAHLAESITINARGEALVPALKVAFERAAALGAQRKAVIFTESRRTQQYLFDLLRTHGYAEQLVTLNGTNNDPPSQAIYAAWLERHAGEEVVRGSKSVALKSALVEHFRDHATILIATEAAAEGVNLQFCSLVVNYDLPWNPQRIEQRIGRCHRYGQQHDVVVVNFLNRRNEADRRVHQLLSEKFKLFDGVFGASDEVLGAIESGVDIERRIAQVYQCCRTTDEIATAFDLLQSELDRDIQARLVETRQALLEHFDEDVSTRLRINQQETIASLGDRERQLLELTRVELDGAGRFDPVEPRFFYDGPAADRGFYHVNWKAAAAHGDTFYRQDHPLAVHLIDTALGRRLPPAMLAFDYAAHGTLISILKPLLGSSGWLELSKLTVTSFDTEEFLVCAAETDRGERLDDEMCRKLLSLPAASLPLPSGQQALDLTAMRNEAIATHLKQVNERNSRFFDEEVIKLDHWADDLKQGLEREIKDLDREIRETRKAAALAASLAEKLEAQRTIKTTEAKRNSKRRELFEAQDAIDGKRDELITAIEQQLQQRQTVTPVFTVRWTLS